MNHVKMKSYLVVMVENVALQDEPHSVNVRVVLAAVFVVFRKKKITRSTMKV